MSSRVGQRSIPMLARDLAVHLRMGTPLPEALDRAATRSPLGEALRGMATDLRGGSSLPRVLEKRSEFPPVLGRVLLAGQAGEDQARAFEQAACILEAAHERRMQMAATLAYPQLLAGALLALMALFIGMLVPVFDAMFTGMNLRLPVPTKIMIALSHLCLNPTFAVAAAVGVVALHVVLGGRFGTDAVRLRLPLIGSWLQRQNTVIWLSWLDFLLARGQPLDEAVRLAAQACPTQAYCQVLEAAAAAVAKGARLSQAMAAQPLVPPFATWLVAQAEAVEFPTGRLAHAADAVRRDLDISTGMGLGLLEPIAIVCIGTFLLFFLASVFLPLYQLIGSLG